MKELVIISGKGGTGKTSMTAAFSSLAENKLLCDADVDAADLHLIMDPEIRESHDFKAGHMAMINSDKCTECGLCRELCRWDAISADFHVDGAFRCAIINTLAGETSPVAEPRYRCSIIAHMRFADEGGLITRIFEQFGKGGMCREVDGGSVTS